MNAAVAADLPRTPRRFANSAALLRWIVVVGILLHLTLRDAVPGLAIVFYALPRGVLTVLALVSALVGVLQRRRNAASTWFGIALAAAVWWWSAEWRSESPPTASGGIRVMYWNICRGHAGWDAIVRQIEFERPDLIALGEAGDHSDDFRALWRERLTQYDISFLGGGMMCLVRGTSSDARVRQIDGRTQVRELDVTIDGTGYRCLIVDVYAHVLYDRRPALAAIARLAEESADVPLLVLGDFNTPLESRHFADLRRRHVNAFEQAGTGYAATWPSFAPVLSLDQAWVNSRVDVWECRHGRTTASDHRPVLLRVGRGAGNRTFGRP